MTAISFAIPDGSNTEPTGSLSVPYHHPVGTPHHAKQA